MKPNTSNGRYICIHGHFYQPPRENPWLESVEVQDSAAPYHDWNERITAECYAPNGASRIVNNTNEIIRIVNNYSRISFNCGPTLLSWLEEHAPRAYRAILQADQLSLQRFSGHGSALAQVYNHIILPLANERDSRTQIRWGIADFERRFGRKPEGMWLAETAVNRASLDLLAQEGIKFTILAPHQCEHIRPIAALEAWTKTPDSTVDTTHPYRVPLDDGRYIDVFFYNGPVSRAIAFEGLLNSGDAFANRLQSAFVEHPLEENPSAEQIAAAEAPQLVHVATDGESYGHHHKYGEMALSYALQLIEKGDSAALTNYGEFLEKFPPMWEAEVAENTSWSCVHGIERWRSDCGCNSGHLSWNQAWRAPLRDALDWLRDTATEFVTSIAPAIYFDLWQARDEYISVIFNRSRDSQNEFFGRTATHPLNDEERCLALRIMEICRQSLLMYTSCAWFFDEISGIETVQVLAYAARLVQLVQHISPQTGREMEEGFINKLSFAPSNLPEIGSGADVYMNLARSKRAGLEQVGAHYAISSIFRSYPEDGSIFCFNVHREMDETFSSGRGKLYVGRATISSRITTSTEGIRYAVLHLGDQNLSAAVQRHHPQDDVAFQQFIDAAREATTRGDMAEVIRLIDRHFAAEEKSAVDSSAKPAATEYSLTSLFADEQRRILKIILDTTLSEVEQSLSAIYEEHASLVRFLGEQKIPHPRDLAMVAAFALNAGIRHALEANPFDADAVLQLIERAAADKVELDKPTLGYVASQRIKRAMVVLEQGFAVDLPLETLLGPLGDALTIAETFQQLQFEVNLWQAQNIWNALAHRLRLRLALSEHGAAGVSSWSEGFNKLGHLLGISVDDIVIDEDAKA